MKPIFYVLIILFSLCYTGAKKTCFTPSSQKGTCISILKCPVLMRVVTQTQISKREIYYLRRSACGFQKSVPMVCCPDPGSCKPTTAPPDRGTGCCGRTAPTRNAAFSARIDEYPWMGLVEYWEDDEIVLKCSSFLISGRYSLSAGQCFYDKKLWPVNVRFGEYDTSHEGPDCVTMAPGTKTLCNTGALSIAIEKVFVHLQYKPIKRRNTKHHDIALIRLAEMVPYSDFISPICLPTFDVTFEPPRPLHMKLAGWGALNNYEKPNYILNHVDNVPYVDFDICLSKFNTSSVRRPPVLGNGQMCAGGKGKDACRGDAGSPLMYVNDHVTEAVGIVSFGVSSCGVTDFPGIYTKIFAYDAWIRGKIKSMERFYARYRGRS